MLKITILDGYIDEPTCLGVPPYISPYPRYLAGSVWTFDKNAQIYYLTIDQIRNNSNAISEISKSDLVIVIAGVSVPGRYLSGFPASPNEIRELLSKFSKPIKVLAGPAAKHGFGQFGGRKTQFVEGSFDLTIKGDAEIVISNLLESKLNFNKIDDSESRKNAGKIRNYAIKGAEIVAQHPFFPNYLIAEIETYRGCTRSFTGGCSFCSEPLKGTPDFRPIKDVIDEVESLYKAGVRHFRIGNQPCIFSYQAKDAGKVEFPRPNPEALEKLFKGIRQIAPDLKTLHIDNANPKVLAKYPGECKRIAKTIIKYHTPGDVAAFGVESADPMVIKENNLKANEDEVFSAIRLLNVLGAKKGSNGMPELLPGLNFVFGLKGETKKTFRDDFGFLKKILDEDLLVRRINLRQIIPIPGTKMYEIGSKLVVKNKAEFKKFKNKVKEEIERPMLEKLLPRGTVLKDIYTEKHDGKLTFGRQVGSYPLLAGVPGVFDLHEFVDVKVVNYGYRSITAVPYPLDINTAPRQTIEAIPGIGKKRAIRIMAGRPFKSKEELVESLDDKEVSQKILEFVKI